MFNPMPYLERWFAARRRKRVLGINRQIETLAMPSTLEWASPASRREAYFHNARLNRSAARSRGSRSRRENGGIGEPPAHWQVGH
jgi:hypothetical protein